MSVAHALRLRPDVHLVPLTLAHAPNMHRWMGDPVVRRNIGLRREPSLDATMAWIAAAQQDHSLHPFAVMMAERHVGNVVLDRIDDYLATGRLSVYIGDAAVRGAGIGLTGIYRLLAVGFEGLGLHKIWLTVHVGNARAIATYTRLGFALEGILRDEFILDGQRLPVLYMGLLRDDFRRLPVEIP
jgi:RimJ/RimL family protein N-acetyltransferase